MQDDMHGLHSLPVVAGFAQIFAESGGRSLNNIMQFNEKKIVSPEVGLV